MSLIIIIILIPELEIVRGGNGLNEDSYKIGKVIMLCPFRGLEVLFLRFYYWHGISLSITSLIDSFTKVWRLSRRC